MVLELPKRPIFSFITIQFIEIKHLLAKFSGCCADIWTFNSECADTTFISLHLDSIQ